MKNKPTKKPAKKPMIKINALVEVDTKKYLERLARKQGISQGEAVRNIIRYYVDATE